MTLDGVMIRSLMLFAFVVILEMLMLNPAFGIAPNLWGGVEWAHPIVRDQVRGSNHTLESSKPLRVDRWDDGRNIEKFIDGQWGCEVLYHRALPTEDEAAALAERWPEGDAQPEAFVVGQMKVAVIVHRSNRIPHITLDQVRELLRT